MNSLDVIYSYIISILSVLSESFFIFYIICKTKKINSKKIKLFISILLTYFASGVITSFNYHIQIWFLMIYNILVFIELKFFYKNQINVIDFLIIGYSFFIINLTSAILLPIFNGYLITHFIAFALSRLILTIFLLIFKNKFYLYYEKYVKVWNRRDDGKIKAITVRNISLIFLNSAFYIIHLLLCVLINSWEVIM